MQEQNIKERTTDMIKENIPKAILIKNVSNINDYQ